MGTPQWIKKLGGHAGELYVVAELSKRGIPAVLLPENFADDDVLVGKKDGSELRYIQVKSAHPDRTKSFILRAGHEKWVKAKSNEFVVFVWLGSPRKNEPQRYWIANKTEVGRACVQHRAHGTKNWERRFYPDPPRHRPDDRGYLDPSWENDWGLFERYRPGA